MRALKPAALSYLEEQYWRSRSGGDGGADDELRAMLARAAGGEEAPPPLQVKNTSTHIYKDPFTLRVSVP